MQTIKIGLAGLGTVGSGVYSVLKRNQAVIGRRSDSALQIKTVVCRNLERARATLGQDVLLSSDLSTIVADPEIDIVIEVMGGIEPARSFILQAIAAGKHVVTANKALLAKHGNEIFKAAQARGVIVAFEAAVAGGIPIIKALREGLAANRIQWVVGIINGTSNFILSTMREQGVSFDQALEQAQKLGYAEADPTFDIEGIDAAHKLAILSSLAFGVPIRFEAAYIEGISHLCAQDIDNAERFGYRIKLLGITKWTDEGLELRVHPTLVPKRRLIANVEGVMNAVLVKGDAVDATLYYGRGAGSEPTASAVIADLVDIARMRNAGVQHQVPVLGFLPNEHPVRDWLPMSATVSSYYLRIGVTDQPGVLADVARIFADNSISIETLMQREAAIGENFTDIVLLTHSAREGDMQNAIRAIEALETVRGRAVMLRKEELN